MMSFFYNECSPPLNDLYIAVACSSVKQPWRLILKLFCNPAFSLLGKSPYTWEVMVCALQALLCHLKSMYVVVIVLDLLHTWYALTRTKSVSFHSCISHAGKCC